MKILGQAAMRLPEFKILGRTLFVEQLITAEVTLDIWERSRRDCIIKLK